MSLSVSSDGTKEVTPVKNVVAEEFSIETRGFWLTTWMICNIMVTMLNKAAFAKVDFKYPYALSTIHMACNIVGAQLYFMLSRTVKPKVIEASNKKVIFYFSLLFSANIAIGNMSLRWVSVNFNQVARALIPALVMFISIVYFGKTYSSARKWAVLPIVFGVILSFYGDMSFTTTGAFYTFLCINFAALKAIMSGELLTGDLKLHPIDLLLKMCPLALVQIGFMAVVTGELTEIYERWPALVVSAAPQIILFSGVLSFCLNVTSFMANKVTSPLTLCIAANVKQVMLVAFGTLYFGDTVSLLNGIGIVVVCVGSFRYGLVGISEKS